MGELWSFAFCSFLDAIHPSVRRWSQGECYLGDFSQTTMFAGLGECCGRRNYQSSSGVRADRKAFLGPGRLVGYFEFDVSAEPVRLHWT